jgi:hypothetical protein
MQRMRRNRHEREALRSDRTSPPSRRELLGDAGSRLSSRAPEPSELDDLAISLTKPMTRRRGVIGMIKLAFVVMAAPALEVPSATAAGGPNLRDEAIIDLTDALMDTRLGGQEFGIFGLVGAAIVFYEAAEVLGGETPSGQPPPSDQPGSTGVAPADCDPAVSFYCGCFGGFCLINGADCGSYC